VAREWRGCHGDRARSYPRRANTVGSVPRLESAHFGWLGNPVTSVPERNTLNSIPRLKRASARNLNLIRELSITQFKLKYTGSALGYVWSLVKPLMLFGIMYLVFSVLLKAGVGTYNFPVQLLVAIVLWTFFVEATSTAMNAIAGAGGLIRKAYFPRWILVIASTASASLSFAINTVLVIIVTFALGHLDLSWRSLLAPLYYIEFGVLVLGISFFLSALFVYFRDLGHIWEILTLVLFYGSAIIFPFNRIPAHLRDLAGMNPMAQIVEDLRHALVDSRIPSMESLIGPLVVIPILISVITFAIGLAVFIRLTPRFAEEL
jgi:ABC-2 type transport system permease protein